MQREGSKANEVLEANGREPRTEARRGADIGLVGYTGTAEKDKIKAKNRSSSTNQDAL